MTTDIDVHVRPGAKRTVVGGSHDGVLTVAVAAPPADGQANDAVRRAVADAFGIRVSAVEIVRGHSSRRKQLRLDGDDTMIAARLAELRG
ncbi:MAG: DUF167 domain-containing protein [Actinobacteria bacterium]|nr:DUF167 domain-containing protein [Actinomycetota bacterium]